MINWQEKTTTGLLPATESTVAELGPKVPASKMVAGLSSADCRAVTPEFALETDDGSVLEYGITASLWAVMLPAV